MALDNMPPHEIRCEVCEALVLNEAHGLMHIREKHPSFYMSNVLPTLKRRHELQRKNLQAHMKQYLSVVLRERWLAKNFERIKRERSNVSKPVITDTTDLRNAEIEILKTTLDLFKNSEV